jgi:hypothetical protein
MYVKSIIQLHLFFFQIVNIIRTRARKKIKVLESFFDTLSIILLEILSKFIDMHINLFRRSRFFFIYQKCQFLSLTVVTDYIDAETNLFSPLSNQ